MIYIATTAYNAEHTIKQCIESVLNQTSGEFIYYLCDNGSTDATGDIIRSYAQKDSRIKPFFNEENHVFKGANQEYWDFRKELNDDDLFCTLDADDSYSLTFLEELSNFIFNNELDFAACGSTFIDQSTNKALGVRALPSSLVIKTPSDFNQYFPFYYQFMRTVWGKVYTGKIVRAMYTLDNRPETLRASYGGDTMTVLTALHHSHRFGIYGKSLHQYYVSRKSTSYQYSPNRFESDVYLYQYALDFLQGLGPVSLSNLSFLHVIYANALIDTIRVLHNSSLPCENKLGHYLTIAQHPVTQQTYKMNDESCKNSKRLFLEYVLSDASDLTDVNSDFDSILQIFLPNCCKAVQSSNCSIFAKYSELLQALIEDDKALLLQKAVKQFKKAPYRDQIKIIELIKGLTEGNSIVRTATDHRFLSQFFSVYSHLLEKDYLPALEEMTDLLLNNRVKDAQGVFFDIYLTLAALLQQEPAYLFGKIQMAEYLFSAKHYQEAAQIVAELEKMGLSEHDDVVKLKKKLARYLPA